SSCHSNGSKTSARIATYASHAATKRGAASGRLQKRRLSAGIAKRRRNKKNRRHSSSRVFCGTESNGRRRVQQRPVARAHGTMLRRPCPLRRRLKSVDWTAFLSERFEIWRSYEADTAVRRHQPRGAG